jgi:hypothetical protein
MDEMKRSKQEKEADRRAIRAESRDNLHEMDPEVARQGTLRMDGTLEEAEQAAQWAIKRNAEVARIRREQVDIRKAS